MVKKKTTEQFKQEVYNLVGDEYTVIGEYKNSKAKILLKHNKCNNLYRVKPNVFLSGRRCPYCSKKNRGKERRLTDYQFRKKVIAQVGNEYTFLDRYVNTRTPLLVRHNICGNTYKVSPDIFLHNKNRCPFCNKYRPKDEEYFLAYIRDNANNDYTLMEEYVNASTPVRIKHKKCGQSWRIKPTLFMQGVRCPLCNNIKGENIIVCILGLYGINYEHPKSFVDLYDKHKLHYDFYLPDYNILIEYQGIQHYKPVDHFGGEEQFKKQQYHDKLKRDYAKANGYNLIEIPYTEDTEERITDYLKGKGLDLTMTKIDKEQIEFKKVNPLDLHGLMINYHYLHRVVACKYAYGMYYQNQLVGMATYTHVRKSLASSISPLANKDNTLELSRLYIKDEVSQNLKNITSKFVSWTLRQLKKEQDGNWFIISFADQGMHHTGAIYQATNFLYCGTTDSGIFCYNGPDKKGGKWVKGHHYRFFILRSIKYRYIMFLGSKTFKKQARKTLKFEIEPYPKQDSVHYSVGDTEERLIRDRQENKVYTETELLKAFPDYDWNGDNGEIIKPIKPKVVNKVNKHFAPVYAISTKTNQVYQFESIRSCAETLNVGERNIKHCLADKKGSLGGFVFCRPDDYTPELASELVEKAKKSPKYNHDFIIDGNWVEGMTKVREIVGASRSSIHKAIDVNRREVKGHTIDIPSPKDIAKHYKSVYQPLATYLIS